MDDGTDGVMMLLVDLKQCKKLVGEGLRWRSPRPGSSGGTPSHLGLIRGDFAAARRGICTYCSGSQDDVPCSIFSGGRAGNCAQACTQRSLRVPAQVCASVPSTAGVSDCRYLHALSSLGTRLSALARQMWGGKSAGELEHLNFLHV